MSEARAEAPAPVVEDPAQRRARNVLLTTFAFRSMGSAMGYLAATTVITSTGDPATVGMRTSLFLAVSFLSALWVPWVPSVGRRFGVARSFAVAMAITGGTIAVVAIPVALAGDTVVTAAMVLLAIAVGAPGALCSVYQPIIVRRVVSGDSLAVAHAYQGIAGSIGWMLGSIAGGLIADLGTMSAVFLLGGLLHLPVVIVGLRTARGEAPEPRDPAASDEPVLKTTLAELRRTPALRKVGLLVAGMTIFIAPMTSMAVPIASELRPPAPQLIVTGAGLLMAAFSLGRLLAPIVVRRLGTHYEPVTASALAGLGAGLFLVLFALASAARGGTRELTDWCVLGLAFGILLYGAKSLSVGAADEYGEDSARSQAIVVLVAAIAGPIGAVAWGWTLDAYGPEAALLMGGIAIMILAVVLTGGALRGRRRAAAEHAG